MLNKIIREAFIYVVGKQASEIVNFISPTKYVNEFLIAKKMGITVNQVRNILYKLSDNGLVSSTRKKDKRKGWYTYFWKIESLKTLDFFKAVLIKKIEQLNYHLRSRENKTFYTCERCKIEFNEETALLYEFTCNECGGIFVVKDNTKLIRELNKNLDKLKKKLKTVEEEIDKEKEKENKKMLRQQLKEEKEKQKKKELKKKTKKAVSKTKAQKKVTAKKKPVKKKVAKKAVSKTKAQKKVTAKKKKAPKKSVKSKTKISKKLKELVTKKK